MDRVLEETSDIEKATKLGAIFAVLNEILIIISLISLILTCNIFIKFSGSYFYI